MDAGFLVIMPDYRGHNDSEGSLYTQSKLATNYYTADVVALLHALETMNLGHRTNRFMWGHSMGGEITLGSLLTTRNLAAASLWSAAGSSVFKSQSHVMPNWRQIDPKSNLSLLVIPVVIHHARNDVVAPFDWSQQLAAELDNQDKTYEFHAYPGSDHLFKGKQFNLAIQRDIEYFQRHMQ